jgi:hypothetical protein
MNYGTENKYKNVLGNWWWLNSYLEVSLPK